MAYKVVEIGDKQVPMLAMASVNIYHKRIFGTDPLKVQVSKDIDTADATNLFMQLGFVMAKMAEVRCSRAAMLALNEESYLDWLDQLGFSEYMAALEDVMELYSGQQQSTSLEKKEET